jgi:hypothetical protein
LTITKSLATRQERSAKFEEILQVSETSFGGDVGYLTGEFNGGVYHRRKLSGIAALGDGWFSISRIHRAQTKIVQASPDNVS